MDPRIHKILKKEEDRQATTIELIASENFASQSVRDLCSTVFTNKYAEGYPGNRYYNGCEHMDEIETLAQQLVQQLYGVQYSNVQPHSGANANTAVYQAFLEPGDKILGMDLVSGGHLSHGAKVNQSGKVYNAVHYGVDENGWIDYKQVADIAAQEKPKMIIAGASAYPRQIDWAAFREIADSVGAFLLVDMSHYSGLIAGGAYDSPAKYADVITSTTHKTLRGPRGGMILWNNPEYTRRINSAVFPGTQGGPLMNIIAAKAQCFAEALDPKFSVYAKQVITNAQAMCKEFATAGIKTLTNGTDSHIILIDLSNKNISGQQAADLLEQHGITVNKNGIPNDPRSFKETSGIRIGTAAETSRSSATAEYNLEWFGDLAVRISQIINVL